MDRQRVLQSIRDAFHAADPTGSGSAAMIQLHFQLAAIGLLSPLDVTAGVVMPLLRAAQIPNPLRRIKSMIPKPERSGNLVPGVTHATHQGCPQAVGGVCSLQICRFLGSGCVT